MEKKIFIPQDWIDEPIRQNGNSAQQQRYLIPETTDLECVIQRIEADRVDITATYSDWINIGFSFADELGENGRNLFHRVSQFYPDYSAPECDKQFDNCLKSRGQGVSLKTFFYLAKDAGVEIAPPGNKKRKHEVFEPPQLNGSSFNQKSSHDLDQRELPTFSDSLFSEIPRFLQKVTGVGTSNEEKDILLLGSLGVISACLPKIWSVYDRKQVYSNLFLFITAQASAGKSSLTHCKRLVNPIHKELRDQVDLDKPSNKMLFIPANNSASGAYQLLADNGGKGLIFETEGDTLSQALKTDYGNYSDGLRKSFHHETLSFFRRKDNEYIDIENPFLSVVLSGTPKQIPSLIPSAENGLLSRFLFYFMNIRPIWKDVFVNQGGYGLDDHFDKLGEEFYELFKVIQTGEPRKFYLTPRQQSRFNQFFSAMQKEYLKLQGLDYVGTVRRLGLIFYRICMIFSALRIMETGDTAKKLICDDRDFEASIAMIEVLVKHSSSVFSRLNPGDYKPTLMDRKEKFLYALPMHFNRQKYLEVASALRIPAKTAEGYITSFRKANLIHRDYPNNYTNTSLEDAQDSKETKDE